jgi:hypothetical protein
VKRFVKVMPVDYRRALAEMAAKQSRPPRAAMPFKAQV